MVPLVPGPFWRVGYPWVGYLEGYPGDRVLPERTLDQSYSNPKGTWVPRPRYRKACGMHLIGILSCLWLSSLPSMGEESFPNGSTDGKLSCRSSNHHITSFYRTSGCPIICTDMYS